MALTDEWQYRIERWQKALWDSVYRPLGQITVEGFVTTRQLTLQEAQLGEFRPMPPGTPWGAKWEYGWFQGSFTLPPEAKGQRVVFFPEDNRANNAWSTDHESLVWINGKLVGSRGWAHKVIPLTNFASGGEHFDILMETYAGHGKVSVGSGPQRYGTVLIPEPGLAQAVVGEHSFGIWLEEVYQLALDFTTLYELHGVLDPHSLRATEVDEALMQVTRIIDVEVPQAEMLKTVHKARKALAPVLAACNGSTAPEMFAFGHAHIDVAWMWPLAETERKMARTVVNQLQLFEEYPEFRFLQSQPHLYCMLQQRYPEVYQRFKQAVQDGKVIADGGMWVEADTNISGGEALIRQILHGRSWFRQELGVESTILWLPDVFGYSGALPQILAGCGMEGFATAKITWAYGGGDPFPYNTFWWEGIDGTAIPAHIFTDYNSHTSPKAVAERWNTRLKKNGISSMLLPFGWGDGGGGPTRDHLEYARRVRDLEGLPRVRMASPAEFFADLKQRGLPKERFVGELYFQAHRGTYTSQSRTKRGNRKAEFALREAEFWGTAAAASKGFDFGPQTLAESWREVLLNQFHDILPGSSIHRVYEEAEAGLGQVIQQAGTLARAAARALTYRGQGFTVFNSLPWPRYVILETSQGTTEVTVPACGWYSTSGVGDLKGSEDPTRTVSLAMEGEKAILENALLRAEINRRGELVSLWDKENSREWLAAPSNVFHMYKDIPDVWDAWDLNSMTESPELEVALEESVMITALKTGPLVASVEIRRKLHDSTLSQVITLRRGSRRLEFSTKVDWQESHKLLKVNFPLTVHAEDALHEIQFGYIRRPTHRSRQFDADRFEVSNHKWSALVEENRGAAILNDCKYGLSVKRNSLNLTLLKAGIAPDPQADRGIHQFTYALYTWNTPFFNSGVAREAYELNIEPLVISGDLGEGSLFSLDAPNIVIETLKPAEDDSGAIIVRLYEAMRTTTRAVLTSWLPGREAWVCDMLENNLQKLEMKNGRVTLDFRPFEIKTLRFH